MMYNTKVAALGSARRQGRASVLPIFVVDCMRKDAEYARIYGRYLVLDWAQWSAADYRESDVVASF